MLYIKPMVEEMQPEWRYSICRRKFFELRSCHFLRAALEAQNRETPARCGGDAECRHRQLLQWPSGLIRRQAPCPVPAAKAAGKWRGLAE